MFLTRCGQELVDNAINVKGRNAKVIYVYLDVEEIPFNDGFFTVDLKFFYRVTLDVFPCNSKPREVEGLVTFDKRIILFGSEGNTKIFSSRFADDALDPQLVRSSNLPVAVVECVDPIVLDVKLVDVCNCKKYNNYELCELPLSVARQFDDEIVTSGDQKRVFISLGQFSVVSLERDSQLLIPSYEFCLPEKECTSNADDGACDLFRRIRFPVDEFCPPDAPRGARRDDCDCR